MERTELKGSSCKWATPKEGGGLFWQTGIFEEEDTTHYFFKLNGMLVAFRRADVIKIEFLATPRQQVREGGAV